MADINKSCSSDEFMFSEFEIHATIFNKKNKNDYFMISSETNQFPLPEMWKDSLYHEIESDYLYRWYTSSSGFQSACSALKIYEDFLCSKGRFFPKKINNNVCMTIGGSGAASLIFDYLKEKYHECIIVLVGMNYSLYERLGRKHNFTILEITSQSSIGCLPTMQEFKNMQQSTLKKVFVFSNPNNPSGLIYDYEKFSKILRYIHEINGFVILDQVCNLPISQKPYLFLENVITECNMWDNAVIVNSFSKTDSTAGFRIGYIYGSKCLIDIVSEIQANSIMNPPTFPVFSIILTCMFRCIYINRSNSFSSHKEISIRNLYRNLFFYTGAIIPNKMREYASEIFNNYSVYYNNYVKEQLRNEEKIIINYNRTLNLLSPYIQRYTELQGGFNFCIWFNKAFKVTELELVQILLEKTGVAILTESAFTLNRPTNKNYFIRFSAACDTNEYRAALERMKNCFDQGGIFDD